MECRVLGPLEVHVDGADRTPGSPSQRRLLAVLLARRGDTVTTDRLLDVLWSDDPPPTAMKTLRTYMSRLRARLGPAPSDAGSPAIVTRSPGYQLVVPPEAIDAWRFESLVERARGQVATSPAAALEALDQALALWRGAAYAEFAQEDFARAEATRLEELRLGAVEERFEALLGLGADARVVAEATAYADAHPLRERPRAQLMRALYRGGRQSEALAAYQRFRHLLADELGVEPSPALTGLHRDILRQHPALTSPELVGAGKPAALPDRGTPAFRTRFVGRERDLAELREALAAGRMLTVLGVGGVGKTRLVAELARGDGLRAYGRVWWCDLSEVTEDGGVATALAAAVGAHERPGLALADALAAHLGTAPAVLVLDNCEQVVDGVAATAGTVLAQCPEVRIIATSRVRVGVDGERVHMLAPLPVPEEDDTAPTSPAVALFVERATAVRPGFAPDPEQTAAVIALCRRLDGLPLAIELAAARMGSLNPMDIGDRLDDRFRFLASSQRTTAGRHRTLAAVVDWSYGLLSRAERQLFERLSVFAGGFTALAAEVICSGDALLSDEVVPLLGRLVDASMVTVGPVTTGRARYQLLETLREYGQRQLRNRGDPRRWAGAHAQHFLALSEQENVRLAGPREAAAVAELDAELGNLRAAHRYAYDGGHTGLALRLGVALWRYAVWRLRDEVFRWAEQAIAMPGAMDDPAFPPACGTAAWGAALRGERATAADLAGRALAQLPPDDPRALRPLEVLLHLALWEGRLADCLRYCEQAAACTDDPTDFLPYTARILALGYAGQTDAALDAAADLRPAADRVDNPTMRANLAYASAEALMGQDPAAAIEHCQRASELAAPVRNQMLLGIASVTLASLHARHGDIAPALRAFRQVITHLYEGSDWTHLWTGLRSLVELLTRAGEYEPASVLHGAVTGAATAPPVYGDDAGRLEEVSRTLTGVIGGSGVAAARRRGQDMRDHDVVAYALAAVDAALARCPHAPISADASGHH